MNENGWFVYVIVMVLFFWKEKWNSNGLIVIYKYIWIRSKIWVIKNSEWIVSYYIVF